MVKRSSLFSLYVSYEPKSFIAFTPGRISPPIKKEILFILGIFIKFLVGNKLKTF